MKKQKWLKINNYAFTLRNKRKKTNLYLQPGWGKKGHKKN
jgi:hypothetical protein